MTVTHHVPSKIGQPVDGRVDAADKLQMLGLAHPLLDEEEDEAGRDEGHGEDNTDGHHHIGGTRPPASKQAEQHRILKQKPKSKQTIDADLQLSENLRKTFAVLIFTLKAKNITHGHTHVHE